MSCARLYLESGRIAHPVLREFYKERDVEYREERRMRTDSDPIGRMVGAVPCHRLRRPSLPPASMSAGSRRSRRVSATEAEEFHAKYYTFPPTSSSPSSATWKPDDEVMLEKILRHDPREALNWKGMTTIEPPQIAEKTVTITESTQPFYIEGYHRPDYRDPDDAVYDAITDIFSNGRTARLYKTLVRDQHVAVAAAGFTGLARQQVPRPLRLLRRPRARPHPRNKCAPPSTRRSIASRPKT